MFRYDKDVFSYAKNALNILTKMGNCNIVWVVLGNKTKIIKMCTTFVSKSRSGASCRVHSETETETEQNAHSNAIIYTQSVSLSLSIILSLSLFPSFSLSFCCAFARLFAAKKP